MGCNYYDDDCYRGDDYRRRNSDGRYGPRDRDRRPGFDRRPGLDHRPGFDRRPGFDHDNRGGCNKCRSTFPRFPRIF